MRIGIRAVVIYLLAIAFQLLAASWHVGQAADVAALSNRVSMQNLEWHVTKLAAMDRRSEEGRTRAANYIAKELEAYGYTVNRQNFTNLRGGGNAVNIIARHDSANGGIEEDKEKLYVLGAHYDSASRTPGADDNASGVAGMLEVARVCALCEFDKAIEFVAFDLEEQGYVGSPYYASNLITDQGRSNILGMINLEMIAYTSREQRYPIPTHGVYPTTEYTNCTIFDPTNITTGDFILALANTGMDASGNPIALPATLDDTPCTSTSSTAAPSSVQLMNSFACAVKDHVSTLPLLKGVVKGQGRCFYHTTRSDHAAFWINNLPAIMLTDTSVFRNPHYHKTTDTVDTLDFEFHTKVVQATTVALSNLAGLKTVKAPRKLAPTRLSLNEGLPLLPETFYYSKTGDEKTVLNVETGYPNHGNHSVAFWATRKSDNNQAVFIADTQNPGKYVRVTDFEPAPSGDNERICWTPDGSALVSGKRIIARSGESKFRRYQPHLSSFNIDDSINKGIGSFTQLPEDNWYVDVVNRNIWAYPVKPDGTDDLDRKPHRVSWFDREPRRTIASVSVTPDSNTLIVVAQLDGKSTIYAFRRLKNILTSHPVTSRVDRDRLYTSYPDAGDQSDEYFGVVLHQFTREASWPSIFPHGSHVGFVDRSGWGRDVFLRDISGKSPARRLAQPGNQGLATPLLGGSRVICSNTSSADPGLSIATLRFTSAPIESPTTSKVNLDDGNGSSISVAKGITISFPAGAKKELFIETPIHPIDPALFDVSMKPTHVARTIGPYGTTFDAFVGITIHFREAELQGGERIESPKIASYDKETGRYKALRNRVQYDHRTKTASFAVRRASTFVLVSGKK